MTKYELYLFETNGDHKPIAKFLSETPFLPASAGERFDDHGWDRLNGVGKIASDKNPKRYLVHSIKHTVVEQDGVLLVQYWLNLEPYEGSRSPVWNYN